MRRRTLTTSPNERIISYKLDPGVFVVETPENGRKISLGQPPDVIKRLQQVGYAGSSGVTTFVVVDSKRQGDSIAWNLVEFPMLYALYYMQVTKGGKTMPAFYGGKKPMLVGKEKDVDQAMSMIKYGNYGVDSIEEFDAMDVPEATREAMRREVLGLAVDNEIKNSPNFIEPVYLDPTPRKEEEFSDIGDGIRIGRVGENTYRFLYEGDHLDVDVSLRAGEAFRSPVEYKHFRFPVMSFGVWHTGEYDGMDPYYSSAHTTLIYKYEPIQIDFPSNMTNIINHHGLSKQSINKVVLTHNHDDHIGALVELFRRTKRCEIITTDPVRYSVIKKLSFLIGQPEAVVNANFEWTILPFMKDDPYRTEMLNMDGLQITGHLSCHSVPTTVYTFHVNEDGYEFNYGHFLDITAFRRMEQLVKEEWMPKAHYEYLDNLIRKTRYNLIKYDAGCINEQALPYTVHGQWQDLKGAATERSYRVFSHAPRNLLDPAHEDEGRFVTIGDLDSTLRHSDGKLVRLGGGKNAITAFFWQAYQAARNYLESLVDAEEGTHLASMVEHYAMAFASCPKQPDPNIGAFLIEQGNPSRDVMIIVRGRALIVMRDDNGEVVFQNSLGDGEVVGDVGVLAGQPRMASVKSINRLSYLVVPANLFIEAMQNLDVAYEGGFKEIFERRRLFQSAQTISMDLSNVVLNRIAKSSTTRKVKKGEILFSANDKATSLLVFPGQVEIEVNGRREKLTRPNMVGECEMLLGSKGRYAKRLYCARATGNIDLMELDYKEMVDIPVLVDNMRRLVVERRKGIYGELTRLGKIMA